MPAQIDLAEAVNWAWLRFSESSDAMALDPTERTINNLQRWIAERWDITIKCVTVDAMGFEKGQRNNREAVAWYDSEAIYIPTARIREAAGGALKERRIARVLAERQLLNRRGSDRRLAIQYIPQVGRIQCYALSRSLFGRGTQPHLKVVEDYDHAI